MEEGAFLRRFDETIARIERAMDETDAECELSGRVLTISFENGAKVVVSTQTPLRQLWLAARTGGRHFSWDGERWKDVRDGVVFEEAFEDVVEGILGARPKI